MPALLLSAWVAIGVVAFLTVHFLSGASIAGLPTGSASTPGLGGDPGYADSNSALCPSTGPTILGIQWDCVAILNLTEFGLLLASIGIVAYVFRDSDWAELPGEAAEVPITAEEWEAYREARSRGSGETSPSNERDEVT